MGERMSKRSLHFYKRLLCLDFCLWCFSSVVVYLFIFFIISSVLSFICGYMETFRPHTNSDLGKFLTFPLKFTEFQKPEDRVACSRRAIGLPRNYYRGSVDFPVWRKKTWRNWNFFTKLKAWSGLWEGPEVWCRLNSAFTTIHCSVYISERQRPHPSLRSLLHYIQVVFGNSMEASGKEFYTHNS